MDIGRLSNRVSFLTATTTDDGVGGQATTWPTTGTTVWAAVAPLMSRDLMQAGALNSPTTHRITIRWRAGITGRERVRVEPDGPTFEIVGIRDVEFQHRWIECDVVEVN